MAILKTSAMTAVVALSRIAIAYTGTLPLGFEPNQGQTDPRVDFLARGRGYTLFLTSTEAVLRSHQAVVRFRLRGAAFHPEVQGTDRLPGSSNYFRGTAKQWRTNVPRYSRVRYKEIYPGIALDYYGKEGELEYDFVLAPGADPNRIRLRIEGAERVVLDHGGDLEIGIAGGQVRLRKPHLYQGEPGNRRQIVGRFVLLGKCTLGFRVAKYDASKTLVIDPLLSYATYLGGSSDDSAEAIAVDSFGNAYVAGVTASSDFPSSAGLKTRNEGQDAFVVKLNASGTAPMYATYLGGGNIDGATGIAVDESGSAYITGYTWSRDFPTLNAVQPGFGGGLHDAFAAKLDPTGSHLVYSTYLGGDELDVGAAITVDPAGNAYVTGSTTSQNFPTAHALQPNLRIPQPFASGRTDPDAFVVKLDPKGLFVYSTYLGSIGTDRGNGIAADAAGNAYVTGIGGTDFPTLNPLPFPSYGAFAAKLDPAGSALVYSTFLGTDSQEGFGIAVDAAGSAYVAGSAMSRNMSKSPSDTWAFVVKLAPAGSPLLYSKYLDGSAADLASAVAVDSDGNAYVAGHTSSADFPTVDTRQLPTGSDTFVAKLSPAGSELVYSTLFRDPNWPGFQTRQFIPGTYFGCGIAVDRSGNAYVASAVHANAVPVTPGALQSRYGGGADAFVAKIGQGSAGPNPPPALASLSPTAVRAGGGGLTLLVNGANFVPGAEVLWNGVPRPSTMLSNVQLQAAIAAEDVARGGFAQITVFNPAPGGGVSNVVPFRIENPVPSIRSATLTPTGLAGRDDFFLFVDGSNFVTGSVVQWNGASRTTLNGVSQLTASIPRSDVAKAGRVQVTAFNPGPGGGLSNTLTLDISPPTIDSISPTRLIAQGGQVKVTIKGTNFTSRSTAQCNGADVTTGYVSPTELTAMLGWSISSAGTGRITVWNPTAPQGLSNAAVLTVIGNPGFSTASLKGAYVFSLAGYDILGPVAMAGRLVLDGTGKITSGVLDRVDALGVSSLDLTGTYSVDPTGAGQATLSSSRGNSQFRFVLSSRAHARLLELDATSVTYGELEKQDADFQAAATSPAAYAFSLRGPSPAGWMTAAGRFAVDGSGAISEGAEDINDTGAILRNTSFSGTYTLDENGRGTANLKGSAGDSRLVFYAVSGSRLILLSGSAVPVVTGEAEKQDASPFSNASLTGDYGFLFDGETATTWDVFLGRMTANGAGGISGGLLDRNSSGTVTENIAFTGTYQVAENGRGELAIGDGPNAVRGAFYLASGRRAKFVQLDAASAVGGALEAQENIPSSESAWAGTFSHLLFGAAGSGPASAVGYLQGDGAGNLTGQEVLNVAGVEKRFGLTGSYTLTSAGKGVVQITTTSTKSRRGFVTLSSARLMLATLDADGSLGGYVESQVNPLPTISDGGLVNSADFAAVAPVAGMIVSLFGENLSTATETAVSVPLPTTLAGVRVLVNGGAAPLFFVSPHQINFQVPWEARGRLDISVVSDSTTGPKVSLDNQLAAAPGIFSTGPAAGGQGLILISDSGELAAPSGSAPGRAARPARPDEFVSIFCTGLGEVSNPPATGAPAPADQLSPTRFTPIVSIGGKAAWVSFSGLAPGYVGLYQVNVQVPADTPAGDAVPVQIFLPSSTGISGSTPSRVVTMAVQP